MVISEVLSSLMVHLITNHGIVLISHIEMLKCRPGHCGAVQDAGTRSIRCFPWGWQGRGWQSGPSHCPVMEQGKSHLYGDEDRDEIEAWGWAEIRHNLCQVFQEAEVSMKLNWQQ